ncbi:MAG: hypothetical protein ACR2HR_17445 [Euzebya sp.]
MLVRLAAVVVVLAFGLLGVGCSRAGPPPDPLVVLANRIPHDLVPAVGEGFAVIPAVGVTADLMAVADVDQLQF